MTDEQLKKFMDESNAIEGEGPGQNDIPAARYVLTESFNPKTDILKLHGLVAEGRDCNPGAWRTIQVYVGKHIPPAARKVPQLMEDYARDWALMDAYQAHNRFEHIHPFEDLNGRMGRLLWLRKAVYAGYRGQLSFLHAYYYQALEHDR